MKLTYALIPAFLLAAGCASKPDDITGYYVSPYKYRDFTCGDIALEALALNNRFLVSQGKTAREAKVDSAYNEEHDRIGYSQGSVPNNATLGKFTAGKKITSDLVKRLFAL